MTAGYELFKKEKMKLCIINEICSDCYNRQMKYFWDIKKERTKR